jgi:6-phosphogluconolactonase
VTKISLLSGSYTGPDGEGLKLLSFDTATGNIELVRSFPGTPDVSWIAFAPNTRAVYVTDEMAAMVGAFSLAPDLAAVTPLGYQPPGAKYPCYLSLSPDATRLAVANYGDDSVPTYAIGPTGTLTAGPVLRGTQAHDTGHAHWTQWSPEGDRLYNVDLGHNEVRSFVYDATTGAFGPPETAFAAPNGAGPRHLAFHPNGKFAYLFTEYAETLTALAREPGGKLTELNTLSALPADFTGESTGAHIQINPAGTVAYVSNRGHNSITVFGIAEDGRISLKQNIDCGGNWPRFFILIGKHLIVANQESEDLVVFDVATDGTLAATGKVFKLQKPVALLPI